MIVIILTIILRPPGSREIRSEEMGVLVLVKESLLQTFLLIQGIVAYLYLDTAFPHIPPIFFTTKISRLPSLPLGSSPVGVMVPLD